MGWGLCWALHLDKATSCFKQLGGAVGWVPRLPTFSGRASWMGRMGSDTQQLSGAMNL